MCRNSDSTLKASKRSIVKELNKSRVGVETISNTKNFFQDIISSKAKGNGAFSLSVTLATKKFSNAVDYGPQFISLRIQKKQTDSAYVSRKWVKLMNNKLVKFMGQATFQMFNHINKQILYRHKILYRFISIEVTLVSVYKKSFIK